MRKTRNIFAVLGIGFLLLASGCSKKKEETGVNQEGDTPMPDVLSIQVDPVEGTIDGHDVTRFLMKNKNGMTVTMMDYGATVVSVQVPDRDGNVGEVTLGYKDLTKYQKSPTYFGGTIGRFSNRIARGKFKIKGNEYTLATNNGPNHLHGGNEGFNNKLWKGEQFDHQGKEVGVKFTYISPDGEEGYPGELKAQVTYSLNDDNELKIDYTATVMGKETPVNLTNHCYWNLAGENTILDHEVTLYCQHFLPVDGTMIPTGEIKNVKDTLWDFTTPQKIGARYRQIPIDPGDATKLGYDHCFIVDKNLKGSSVEPILAARVYEPTTGRVMEVLTDQPGLQFYIGVFLDGTKETGGFPQYGGFCLESQQLPDAPNQPTFPNSFIKPGEVYHQATIHRFSVKK